MDYLQKLLSSMFVIFLLLTILYLSGKGTRLLQNPFDLSKDFSALHRVEAWWASIQLYLEHPLAGIGTGSFQTIGKELFPWLPTFRYPHNLLFEVACENGSIGLLILLLFITIIIVRGFKLTAVLVNEDKLLASYIFALIVFSLLNSMVSGDITMNAEIWLFAGFLSRFYNRKIMNE